MEYRKKGLYHHIDFLDQSFTYWFERQRSRPCWVFTKNVHGRATQLFDTDSERQALLLIGTWAEEEKA